MSKEYEWFMCVDCGVKGAVVLMNRQFELTALSRMPTMIPNKETKSSVRREVCSVGLADVINNLILECGEVKYDDNGKITNIVGLIEDPGKLMHGGPVSLASTTNSFGIMKGVFSGIGIPYLTAGGQKWKNKFGLKGGAKFKKDSVALAIELHPEIADHITNVTDDADIAEAVLVGDYLARYVLGIET